METQTSIKTPIEALLSELNISAYSKEEQEQLLAELSSVIFKGSLARLVERMDDKTREEFSELMDKKPEGDELVTFLRERVTGADDVILEVVKEITEDISALNVPESAT